MTQGIFKGQSIKQAGLPWFPCWYCVGIIEVNAWKDRKLIG